MGTTVKHYEGRGRLMQGDDFVAHVLYSLEAWQSDTGAETIIGSIAEPRPNLAEGKSSTMYVLHMTTGATLVCSLSPLSIPHTYAITASGSIQAPFPR